MRSCYSSAVQASHLRKLALHSFPLAVSSNRSNMASKKTLQQRSIFSFFTPTRQHEEEVAKVSASSVLQQSSLQTVSFPHYPPNFLTLITLISPTLLSLRRLKMSLSLSNLKECPNLSSRTTTNRRTRKMGKTHRRRLQRMGTRHHLAPTLPHLAPPLTLRSLLWAINLRLQFLFNSSNIAF